MKINFHHNCVFSKQINGLEKIFQNQATASAKTCFAKITLLICFCYESSKSKFLLLNYTKLSKWLPTIYQLALTFCYDRALFKFLIALISENWDETPKKSFESRFEYRLSCVCVCRWEFGNVAHVFKLAVEIVTFISRYFRSYLTL